MIDFLQEFIGSSLMDYPFLAYAVATILAGCIIFMFYTIVASLFRIR